MKKKVSIHKINKIERFVGVGYTFHCSVTQPDENGNWNHTVVESRDHNGIVHHELKTEEMELVFNDICLTPFPELIEALNVKYHPFFRKGDD